VISAARNWAPPRVGVRGGGDDRGGTRPFARSAWPGRPGGFGSTDGCMAFNPDRLRPAGENPDWDLAAGARQVHRRARRRARPSGTSSARRPNEILGEAASDSAELLPHSLGAVENRAFTPRPLRPQ
jgi:hypothetical protein